MRNLFKFSILAASMAMVMMGTTSCSDSNDDDSTHQSESAFKDKTYGQEAVRSCANVVSQLEAANKLIGSANLTADQESYLRSVISNVVDNVIVPTYTNLANETEALESELRGLTVNNITQAQIDKACESFKNARLYWERSEAFLGGAASDFDVDPTIDSWPLNRALLLHYFNSGTMDEETLDDATILGFHGLEFILFRDGQPRKVSEFKGKDSYKGFENVSGEKELLYAQQICKLLKERTFQLQVAWEGEKNSSRVAVVKAAGLEYTTENGLSYGENMKRAGDAVSTFTSVKDAVSQLLADEEGSAAAIATEVGTAKIANPFSAGDISYVESPYSYRSIPDFQDNMRSVQNVWNGTLNGSANSGTPSFANFFSSVNATVNTSVVNAVAASIKSIGGMPAPFVKYCSTIWGIAFEDDEDWE